MPTATNTRGLWNFAAATAASATKAILERYIRRDKVVNTPDGDGEPIQTHISSTIADNRIVVGSQKNPVTAMPRANVGETPGHGPRLTEGWPTERRPNPSLNNFGPGDQFNVPRGTLNTSKGGGNHFSGATFSGPVQFPQGEFLQRALRQPSTRTSPLEERASQG
ncbi:hypothetical protein MGU_10902 [Metarhizium guizhouense ARSEF 977]|uniref:NACHT-NTPase sigma domain-containing protein n=1 Tax=Metarhizium guizhouense (strain ARSEF 977) TaxID=1276136 RepID=A0A0B4GPU0_METGA|nr:hypothetical protein MGU_10902 [Metarhizium guizhouense ARSEF 977]